MLFIVGSWDFSLENLSGADTSIFNSEAMFTKMPWSPKILYINLREQKIHLLASGYVNLNTSFILVKMASELVIQTSAHVILVDIL